MNTMFSTVQPSEIHAFWALLGYDIAPTPHPASQEMTDLQTDAYRYINTRAVSDPWYDAWGAHFIVALWIMRCVTIHEMMLMEGSAE